MRGHGRLLVEGPDGPVVYVPGRGVVDWPATQHMPQLAPEMHHVVAAAREVIHHPGRFLLEVGHHRNDPG